MNSLTSQNLSESPQIKLQNPQPTLNSLNQTNNKKPSLEQNSDHVKTLCQTVLVQNILFIILAIILLLTLQLPLVFTLQILLAQSIIFFIPLLLCYIRKGRVSEGMYNFTVVLYFISLTVYIMLYNVLLVLDITWKNKLYFLWIDTIVPIVILVPRFVALFRTENKRREIISPNSTLYNPRNQKFSSEQNSDHVKTLCQTVLVQNILLIILAIILLLTLQLPLVFNLLFLFAQSIVFSIQLRLCQKQKGRVSDDMYNFTDCLYFISLFLYFYASFLDMLRSYSYWYWWWIIVPIVILVPRLVALFRTENKRQEIRGDSILQKFSEQNSDDTKCLCLTFLVQNILLIILALVLHFVVYLPLLIPLQILLASSIVFSIPLLLCCIRKGRVPDGIYHFTVALCFISFFLYIMFYMVIVVKMLGKTLNYFYWSWIDTIFIVFLIPRFSVLYWNEQKRREIRGDSKRLKTPQIQLQNPSQLSTQNSLNPIISQPNYTFNTRKNRSNQKFSPAQNSDDIIRLCQTVLIQNSLALVLIIVLFFDSSITFGPNIWIMVVQLIIYSIPLLLCYIWKGRASDRLYNFTVFLYILSQFVYCMLTFLCINYLVHQNVYYFLIVTFVRFFFLLHKNVVYIKVEEKRRKIRRN